MEGGGGGREGGREGGEDKIQVCVRVRPLDATREEEEEAWGFQENVITQTIFPAWEAKSLYRQAGGRAQIAYGFDHLFNPTQTTNELYSQALRDLVRAFPPSLPSSLPPSPLKDVNALTNFSRPPSPPPSLPLLALTYSSIPTLPPFITLP